MISRPTCLAELPKALRERIRNGYRVSAAGGDFSILAVAAGRVYGASGPYSRPGTLTSQSMASVQPGKDDFQVRARMPQGAGIELAVASDKHVIWRTADSLADPSLWSLYAADVPRGSARRVGGTTQPHSSHEGFAGVPALSGDLVAWNQSRVGKSGVSDLRMLDLKTGQSSVLAHGKFFAPVAMGNVFVWSETLDSGSSRLRAVDATTGNAVSLPPDLPITAGIGHLAATPERLLWANGDFTMLYAWEPSTRRVVRYAQPKGDLHGYQFMQVSGDWVGWFAADTYRLMDLRTGATYDLGLDTAVTVGDGVLGVAFGSIHGTAHQATQDPQRVSVIPLSELPATASCPDAEQVAPRV